jgi:cyclophilin family peptidyl-prolyl cis-trans isomerase
MALVRTTGRPLPDSAQIIIFVTPQPALDGQYTAFARVNEGLEIVDKISQQPLDAKGLLVDPVRISKISIEPKKVEPFRNASVDELRRTVTLKTTLGTLKIRTAPEWAPENVRAFLNLAASGWYNGTDFHRIAKGFVVQGGMGYSRRVDGAEKPTHAADRWVHPLPAEFRDDVKHVRGIVSMARGSDPNSAETSILRLWKND